MANNLQEEYEEIVKYLKTNDFNIFFASKIAGQTTRAIWDNSHEWKEFFEVAKKENDMIFVESEIIDQEKISAMNKLKEDDPSLKFNVEQYSNRMVMFAFSFFAERVKHELRKTDGPVEIMKKLTQISEKRRMQEEVGLSEDGEDEEIPSEREIERRFVEYMDILF